MTAPQSTPQQIQISAQFIFGLQTIFPNVIFQYQEPVTTLCQFYSVQQVPIAANTNNVAINLATLFPQIVTPVAYGFAEITQPSVALNIKLASSGTAIQLANQGWSINRVRGGLPTIYVDNTDPANNGLLEIFVMGN